MDADAPADDGRPARSRGGRDGGGAGDGTRRGGGAAAADAGRGRADGAGRGPRRAARGGRLAARPDAWAALLPRVGVQTGFNRSDILQRTATDPVTGGTIQLPDSLIRQRQSFGTTAVVSLDWTVFDGGRMLAGTGAARAR